MGLYHFKGLIYDVHCNIKVHSRIVFLGDCKTIFMFLWLIKDSKPMVDSLINSKRIKRRLKSIHDFELHTQISRSKNILLEKSLEKSNLSKSKCGQKTELHRKDD